MRASVLLVIGYRVFVSGVWCRVSGTGSDVVANFLRAARRARSRGPAQRGKAAVRGVGGIAPRFPAGLRGRPRLREHREREDARASDRREAPLRTRHPVEMIDEGHWMAWRVAPKETGKMDGVTGRNRTDTDGTTTRRAAFTPRPPLGMEALRAGWSRARVRDSFNRGSRLSLNGFPCCDARGRPISADHHIPMRKKRRRPIQLGRHSAQGMAEQGEHGGRNFARNGVEVKHARS